MDEKDPTYGNRSQGYVANNRIKISRKASVGALEQSHFLEDSMEGNPLHHLVSGGKSPLVPMSSTESAYVQYRKSFVRSTQLQRGEESPLNGKLRKRKKHSYPGLHDIT